MIFLRIGLPAALIAAGLWLAVDGLTIKAKAAVAQVLLAHSWLKTRDGVAEARPWPWADTWPVARLRAPAQDVDLIVLAGATGRTLAFGPGHHDGSARPGGAGLSVLTGHRDTHFAFLRDIALGDLLEIDTPEGSEVHYRVVETAVVHKDDLRFTQAAEQGALLALVTCWPYDALIPGGPMRHVVIAEAMASPGARPQRPHALRHAGDENQLRKQDHGQLPAALAGR